MRDADDAGTPRAGDGAGRDAPTLLALLWLASPALPVGAFSYSEGLESAVEAGVVAGEADAARWLLDQLDLVLARADLPLMLRALDAWRRGDLGRVAALNDWVRRTRESSEALAQSEQTGRSLAGWLGHGGTAAHVPFPEDGAGTAAGTGTAAGAAGHAAPAPAASGTPAPARAPGSGTASAAALDGHAAPPAVDPRVGALAALEPAPTWPVAFALAAAQSGATPRDAALACTFGWAENMAQAAMKAVPLGQAAAQRLLGRLAAAMPEAVEAALRRAAIDGGGVPGAGATAGAGSDAKTGSDAGAGLQAYAPGWAILSSRHEAQYSRLFRS